MMDANSALNSGKKLDVTVTLDLTLNEAVEYGFADLYFDLDAYTTDADADTTESE
jgi:hypothetical protein